MSRSITQDRRHCLSLYLTILVSSQLFTKIAPTQDRRGSSLGSHPPKNWPPSLSKIIDNPTPPNVTVDLFCCLSKRFTHRQRFVSHSIPLFRLFWDVLIIKHRMGHFLRTMFAILWIAFFVSAILKEPLNKSPGTLKFSFAELQRQLCRLFLLENYW